MESGLPAPCRHGDAHDGIASGRAVDQAGTHHCGTVTEVMRTRIYIRKCVQYQGALQASFVPQDWQTLKGIRPPKCWISLPSEERCVPV